MGRNNPTVNQNPATKWLEWQGSEGTLYYYDKEQEENINVELPFTFLLIERMSTVGGWHDRSESGIYSNEVKNIGQEPLTVQSFKGGEIASGIYRNIKDNIKSSGGFYVESIYIGYKENGDLVLGNIKLKGAALSAWMEFCRKSGRQLWDKAVTITGSVKGQKGSIEYLVPEFELRDCSEQTHEQALELDTDLQEYLKNRPTNQIETTGEEHIDEDVPPPSDEDLYEPVTDEDMQEAMEDDDLPF